MNNEQTKDLILALLSDEPMRFSELSDQVGGDPSFLSNIVSQMRKAGEIDMRPDRTLEVGRIVPSMFTGVTAYPAADDPAPDAQVQISLRRKIIEKLAESDVKLTVNQLTEKIYGKTGDAFKTIIRTELKIMGEEEVVEKDGGGYYTLTSNPKPHPSKFQRMKSELNRESRVNTSELYGGNKHRLNEEKPHNTERASAHGTEQSSNERHTERKDGKIETLKQKTCPKSEPLDKIKEELERVKKGFQGGVENKEVKIMVLKALAEVVPQETRNVIISIIDDIK